MPDALPQSYINLHPAFLTHAGKPAMQPNTITNTQVNEPVIVAGEPFHVCNGYLIPSYLRDAQQDETKERLTLAHELAHRYFRAVERDDDAEITEGDVRFLHEWYESLQEKDPEIEDPAAKEKNHTLRKYVGAAYIALLVKRIENLSEEIIEANGEGQHDDKIQRAHTELKAHFTTLLSDHDLLNCPKLSGGKPDTDGIIPEMLSETAKAAIARNGEMLPLEDLHRNRLTKIGEAMELMDATCRTLMEEILPTIPISDSEKEKLASNVQEYTDASRTRVGIRRSDRINYLSANAERKTMREIVKNQIHELDVRYRDNPDIHHALDAMEEGRSLIDDMCFYRHPMPKTLDAFRQKLDLPKWQERDAGVPDPKVTDAVANYVCTPTPGRNIAN